MEVELIPQTITRCGNCGNTSRNGAKRINIDSQSFLCLKCQNYWRKTKCPICRLYLKVIDIEHGMKHCERCR